MKKYWYVGHENGTGKMVAFFSNTTPTYDYFGHCYFAVTGPFKTKRAALWAEKYGQGNPHFQHVNDAERISRENAYNR